MQPLEHRLVLSAVDWTGASGGSWDVGSNWSTGAVPGPADDVTIDTSAAVTITIQSGDNITVKSLTTGANDSLSISGASLATTGDLTNDGTLTVDARSKVSVDGNFTQSAAGTLSVEIGGPSAGGQFGQVAVQNTALLGGTLNVTFVSGYAPQSSDDFQVLTFTSESGNFASVTGLGTSLYEHLMPTSVSLSVPPPDQVESPIGTDVSTAIGQGFYTTVAKFSDLSPFAQSNEFVTAIDWGDGTTSGGNVGGGGGQFQVSAPHDYAHSGDFTVTTTIVDHGVATTTTSTAVVLPMANGRINVTTSADTHAASPATSPVDSAGNISLRSAIEYLNATGQANDTIGFDGNFFRGPLQLTLGPVEIDASLTIDGSSVYQLTISPGTATNSPLFQIDALDGMQAPVTVTISNLTLNLPALPLNNGTPPIENLGSLTLSNANFNPSLAGSPAGSDTVTLVGAGGQLIGSPEINGTTVPSSDDVGLKDNGDVYPFKTSYSSGSSSGLNLVFDRDPTIVAAGSGSTIGDTVTVGQSVPVPASDVVADWRFQEGAAGQLATGTIVDSSGNGLNGTAFNRPVYSSNVPFASVPQTGRQDDVSLALNGTNQRVFVPDSPSLALTHSLTIEALVYVTAVPKDSQGYVFFRGDDRGGLDPYTLAIQSWGNSVAANFNIDDASGHSANVSAQLPGLDQWVDIVGTLDDATGVMRLYVNGAVAAATATSVRPFAVLDAALNPGIGIGSTQSPNFGQFFQGLVNEVRICNVALTPDQFLGSTPGNFIVTDDGGALLNEPASALDTLTLVGGQGADTFDISPSTTVKIAVQGGATPNSAPSGTLILPRSGALSETLDAARGYSGTWSSTGDQPVTFDGIQTLEQKLPNLAGDPNANYVTAVYHDVLGRAPDADGLAYWTDLLNQGTAISSVAEAIAHSAEYYANSVIKPDYLKLLGRAADSQGLIYWTTKLEAGLTDQQLEASLVSSDEFFRAAGGTPSAWVDAVYKLVLGRPARADDTGFWLRQLSGGATLLSVAQDIANSQENDAQLIKNDYFHYLGRTADNAGLAYWLTQLANGQTNEDCIAGFTGSAEYYSEHAPKSVF